MSDEVNKATQTANRNLDKASETINYTYEKMLKEQEERLDKLVKDRLDYETAIYVKVKAEIKVSNAVNRLLPYLRAEVLRQIAESLMHKAESVERMDKELSAANKLVRAEMKKEDNNE